ncbi:hypothetical protein B0H21DRAFT_867138 [Amylocystis lapponica]|nr:hypothetical protein B0H21DRAFT_867138 [Amylocystis lapponica]
MLPFGLKIAWCTLSLAGLLSNLVGLPVWAGALGGYWIPVVYFMGNAVLQIMFCLGMVWKMNPFQMPRAFCTAQAALMPIAWYILTILSAYITATTSLAIFRSYGSRTMTVSEIYGTLRWRNTFLPGLVAFPTIVFIAYIVVAVRLNALRPSEGMNCDATHPTWVRLLSYAGMPLVLALPSFLLSCTSAVLLLLSLKHTRGQMHKPRTRNDAFTPLPSRRSQPKLKYAFEPTDINALSASIALETLASPASEATANDSGTIRSISTHSLTLHVLPSPPRSLSGSFSGAPQRRAPVSPRAGQHVHAYHLPFSWDPPSPPAPPDAEREHYSGRADERDMLRAEMAGALGDGGGTGDGESGSLRWRDEDAASTGKSELEFARVESYVDDSAPAYAGADCECAGLADGRGGLGLDAGSVLLALADRTPWYRSSAVRRLVFFQLFSSTTQILAAVSSLVDMFRGRSVPTPFGTQHVALLLAAWGPCIAFGVVPCSRRPHA